jgi:hypothetical protein
MTLIPVNTKDLTNQIAKPRQKSNPVCPIRTPGNATDEIRTKHDDQKDAKQCYLLMHPRAWRSALEPAELSFRVPHFFHQTRSGPVQLSLFDAHFPGNQKINCRFKS